MWLCLELIDIRLLHSFSNVPVKFLFANLNPIVSPLDFLFRNCILGSLAVLQALREVLIGGVIESPQDQGAKGAKDITAHKLIWTLLVSGIDIQEMSDAWDVLLLQCELVRFAEDTDVLLVDVFCVADRDVVLNRT